MVSTSGVEAGCLDPVRIGLAVVREEELGVLLLGQLFQFPHRCHARYWVEVETRDDLALDASSCVNGVPREQHGPAPVELYQKADVPGCMSRRLNKSNAFGDLGFAGDQLVLWADLVEAEVGVAQAFERLAIVAGLELEAVSDGRRVTAVLVPADVVEVVMRVDDMGYVLGREPDGPQLSGNCLVGGLERLLEW